MISEEETNFQEHDLDGRKASSDTCVSAGTKTFEQLFKHYYSRLCYFSFQIVGDKEIAKDIAQDAFVKYFNQAEQIQNEFAVKNFLYSTARNASINFLRHNKVVQNHLLLQDPFPLEENNVIHTIIKAEVFAEIYAAIESLPASCRRISRMAYLEGLKNSEIAETLNISVNTVKTQKQRALQLLRLKLTPDRFLILFVILGFHNLHQ